LSILFLFEIFLIIEGDLKSVDNVVFIQSEYKILQTEFLVNTSWIDSVISPTNVDVIGSVLFTYYWMGALGFETSFGSRLGRAMCTAAS
jgi:hypothetical protein